MKQHGIVSVIVGALVLGCTGQTALERTDKRGKTSGTKAESKGSGDDQASQGQPAKQVKSGVGFSLRLPPAFASTPQSVSADAELSKAFAMGFASDRIRIACTDQSEATFDSVKGKDMTAIIAITLTGSSLASSLPSPEKKGGADGDEAGGASNNPGMDWADSDQILIGDAAGPNFGSDYDVENHPCGEVNSETWTKSDKKKGSTLATSSHQAPGDKDETIPTEPSNPVSADPGCTISTDASYPDDSGKSSSSDYAWSQTVLYPYTCTDSALVTLDGLSANEVYVVDALLYSPDGVALYSGWTDPFMADQKAIELPMSAIESSSAMLEIKFID